MGYDQLLIGVCVVAIVERLPWRFLLCPDYEVTFLVSAEWASGPSSLV